MPARGPAVGQDLVHRVAPRDPGDPAAAVGGRTGLVQAPDRGTEVRVAGGGTGVEHLAQAQLAVEDVATHEPVLLLHLMRADDLPVQHRVREPGSDRLHPRDHPVGEGRHRGLVGAVGVGVRHPLGEHRHDVVPRGRQRVVEHARDADVGERQRRRLPGHRLLERRLEVVEALGQHDRAAMHLGIGPRMAGEHRQPVQHEVDLHGAAAGLPGLDLGDEAGRQHTGVQQPQERDLRVRGGDHDTGIHLLAGGQGHAGDPAAAGADPGDLGPGADLGAERARGGGERRRHPAHAAAREPPCPGLPVHATDVVVQHDVTGAVGPRPGPGADHPGHRQQAAHRVAGEVAVHDVGDAGGQQPGHVHRGSGVQLAQVPQQEALPPQVPWPP